MTPQKMKELEKQGKDIRALSDAVAEALLEAADCFEERQHDWLDSYTGLSDQIAGTSQALLEIVQQCNGQLKLLADGQLKLMSVLRQQQAADQALLAWIDRKLDAIRALIEYGKSKDGKMPPMQVQ